MMLLTKEIKKAFRKQGDTSNMDPKDIKIICKFFNPSGVGTWYCYEFNEKDGIFWCFADLGISGCAECGTVALSELESIKGTFGLGIERDLYFGEEHTLAEVIKRSKN